MIQTVRKVLQILGPEERPRLVRLVLVMIVAGLLQTVGIASIMPFLAVVANPGAVTESTGLAWAYSTFGFDSPQRMMVALGMAFAVVMVVSNGLSILTSWITVRTQARIHHRLSQRLIETYLRRPYSFHLNHNSAQLGSSLLVQVWEVTNGVFLPCTQVVARGLSSIFIVSLLVIVDPFLATVLSLTIGGFYALVYSLVRHRQRRLGEVEVESRNERFQIADEAFGGIKEVKVLDRESYFVDQFDGPSARFARARAMNSLIGMMPRFALETLAYGGIVVVVLYLIQARQGLDQIFPLLAVYAFGANRLIPAVQEIFMALNRIQYQSPALDQLHVELCESEHVPSGHDRIEKRFGRQGLHATPSRGQITGTIRFEEVTFSYPGGGRPALRGVSFEIPANRTVAFVGETGSGKTTLVDILLGLFTPDQGAVWVGPVQLSVESLPAWRRSVGYVPQSIFLRDASIAENIAFGIPKDQIDFGAVKEAARAAHLDDFVATLPQGYETIVGERGVRLSGGQRQRIGIARALYASPVVLILDEATSALDNVTEDIVMQAIRELSDRRTIVLVAHRLTTVQECDTIFVLDQGRVVAQGSYEELLSSNATFRAMARA